MSDEKTYRSYGVTKLDDNFRISLNIKWLIQIIVGVGFIVMGYLRIENRIADLERRMESANSSIEELVEKHIEEEEVKKIIKQGQSRLGEQGRVLIRKSGTEPLIRVMVEGQCQEMVAEIVASLGEVIQKFTNKK